MKSLSKKIFTHTIAVLILISLVFPTIAYGANRRVQILEGNEVVNIIVVDEKTRLIDIPIKPNQRVRFENATNRHDFVKKNDDSSQDEKFDFTKIEGLKLIEELNVEDFKRPEMNNKKMTAIVVSAIKELNLKVRELENGTSTRQLANPDGTLTTPIANIFKNLGVIFEVGITHMKALAVETLRIGSRDNPAGITMHDYEGGGAYCVKIVRGNLLSTPGECAAGSQGTSVPGGIIGSGNGQQVSDSGNNSNGSNATTTDSVASTTPSTSGGSTGSSIGGGNNSSSASTTPNTSTSTPSSTPSSGSTASTTPSVSTPSESQASTTPPASVAPSKPVDTTPAPQPEPQPEPEPQPAPVVETPAPTPEPTPAPTPTPAPSSPTPAADSGTGTSSSE